MAIDWNVVATIAQPVIGLVLGVYINRWFEHRPKLITYYGHVSTHRVAPTNGGPPYLVYTHAVVLRNAGRQAATNIRVQHANLPNFHIFPPIAHQVNSTPGGSEDIVIPSLVPGEQVEISYLYFPPLTAAQVNTGIKCDQGFATQIPVLLQRQTPRWLRLLINAVFAIGLISVVYLGYLGAAWLTQKLAN
ncbi:hypothetical protein ACUXAV_000793 [Cupriavidus metallidurans]|uniref:hypothetical protein n=1 Tax=Cupriavidus TaxID=106589 RepID=UPI00069123BB|nr:hypothetical protein [Cupriavidus metallidurans]KWW37566.1 hypothetical protein AU374_01331 [Cupriavidus metallidurans]MDE4918694.1 hypothetical protein [Cupriavidus metallidurans]